MQITAINIYPVKSCRRVELTEALVTPIGLAHDRRWMLVDEKHRFITARRYPNLLRVAVEISDAGFIGAYPGMPGVYARFPDANAEQLKVKIWQDEVMALDAGTIAAEWFSQIIGLPCRLVWSASNSARLLKTSNFPAPPVPADKRQIAFPDSMPILLTNEASLSELNKHLTATASMHQFRPNLVINGTQAWEEESWKKIRIGELELQATKTCVRCILTTSDPNSGKRHINKEPLNTLKKIHNQEGRGPIFGMQFVALNSGILRLGQELFLE